MIASENENKKDSPDKSTQFYTFLLSVANTGKDKYNYGKLVSKAQRYTLNVTTRKREPR